MNSVAAVVVTFNRKALLVEALRALLAQSRPVDRIYVIDNASSDGTEALLQQEGLLSQPTIEYCRLAGNMGGAGGFAAGFDAAFAAGHDWIWVMDDDAEPETAALERLEPHFSTPGVAAVASLVVNPSGSVEFAHRGWFKPLQGDSIVRSIRPEDLAGVAVLPVEFASFVGACISAVTVKKIGLPKKEFFIHNDDLEYSLRMRLTGQVLLVTNSRIVHKEVAVHTLINKKGFAVPARRRVEYDRLWLQFFGYRNLMWLAINRHVSAKLPTLVLLHLRKLLGVVLFDDHKLSRIKFWNAALLDAARGNFDNAKPKRLTGYPTQPVPASRPPAQIDDVPPGTIAHSAGVSNSRTAPGSSAT